MELKAFISNALKEDIGPGDYTALACIPQEAMGKAKLLAKESGVIAGIEIAQAIANELDSNLVFELFKKDGDLINTGDIIFTISGSSRSILGAERLMLNCMQRMSGIATVSQRLQNMISPYKCKVLDTRKTTPGMRYLEKLAVKIGGGFNHRMGLYDMMMIKDNHIDYAGGIEAAILKADAYIEEHNLGIQIEIEARNLTEVEEILRIGKVQRIMLDNFSIVDLETAVKRIAGNYETEASGGITEETIVSYAKTGVNYISVGALTHSVKSLDLSLKAL